MSQKLLSASTMAQQRRPRFSGYENPKSHSVMRQLLLLVVIHGLLTPVQSVNGVIWDKKISDFVPIISKPIFAAMNQQLLDRSRARETHNFQGRTFRFSYYEIESVISSDKNGTSIAGYIGETWTILAEYLHFRLKPEISNTNTLGTVINGTYTPGLLKMMLLNQTDIIARVEAMPQRLAAVQLTIPLRKARCYIFTRQKRKHVTTWMLKLFSREVWFATLATYIILSICSYIFHVIEVDMFGGNTIPNILDSLFYNLGMICTQNCDTSAVSKSSKMIECLASLFALLINAAFNALVIGYVTQVAATTSFGNIISFLKTGNYMIIVVKGSLMHTSYEDKSLPGRLGETFILVNNLAESYKTLCSRGSMAMHVTDEMSRSMKYPCKLQSLGITRKIYIASGISWHIENKRTIDIGLLKLYENGILTAIQRHWLIWWKEEESHYHVPVAIDLEQVYLIHLLFFGGILMSLIIFILEQIAFHCNKQHNIRCT